MSKNYRKIKNKKKLPHFRFIQSGIGYVFINTQKNGSNHFIWRKLSDRTVCNKNECLESAESSYYAR